MAEQREPGCYWVRSYGGGTWHVVSWYDREGRQGWCNMSWAWAPFEVWPDRILPPSAAPSQPQDGDGWQQWSGGACPLPEHYFPEVRYRSGGVTAQQANRFRWTHTGAWDDILAYQVRHVLARDGIEAQHGLNDVYPGDDYPAPPSQVSPDAEAIGSELAAMEPRLDTTKEAELARRITAAIKEYA